MIQDLAVASDHAGYELKQFLIKNLKDNLNITDFGTNDSVSCDFPDYAKEVCNYILENKTLQRFTYLRKWCWNVYSCKQNSWNSSFKRY